MRPIIIALGICLASIVAEAAAQCPHCQPTAMRPSVAPTPVLVRQRVGLFGWRARWVVLPMSKQPLPPIYVIR